MKEKEINKRVGNRLRYFRKASGRSQKELSGVLGVSFQQVQKYETGVNRLSAGKLYICAQYFDIPVEKFFK